MAVSSSIPPPVGGRVVDPGLEPGETGWGRVCSIITDLVCMSPPPGRQRRQVYAACVNLAACVHPPPFGGGIGVCCSNPEQFHRMPNFKHSKLLCRGTSPDFSHYLCTIEQFCTTICWIFLGVLS